MARRYLFGPVSARFAQQNLKSHLTEGECLAFDPSGETGLRIGQEDSWEIVCSRLPRGWQPNFLVLDLHYTDIPACLWTAPVPRVSLAADWTLLWHYYRRCLPLCELVLTDTLGVEHLALQGITQARVANLFGCEQRFLQPPSQDVPRDIDVLFVGRLHPAIQRERLSWLQRLARLGSRWRVLIASNVHGEDYVRLLRRARIVFNRSIRQEANLRLFEAAAAGALVFQEEENREAGAYFHDRQEYVAYTADNLEALLDYYLEHEDERQALASAAQAKVVSFSFDRLWQEQLQQIELALPALQERAAQRVPEGEEAALQRRLWQLLGSNTRTDRQLAADLQAALLSSPDEARLHNALGLVHAAQRPHREWASPQAAEAALPHLHRAWQCEPRHAIAGLNLAEALACCGRRQDAIQQARRTLDVLESQQEPLQLDSEAGHFPPPFDLFRVEWERAAWHHAGQPLGEAQAKQTLLRWRLHALLGELTGDVAHFHEAGLARPDLPETRAYLGQALHRHGRYVEAVSHLRQAVAGNPLDSLSACTLFTSLGKLGLQEEQRRLACDCQLLHQAAPGVVPAEPWLTAEEGTPPALTPSGPPHPLRVIWEGPFQATHSFTKVNQAFCRRLLTRRLELSLLPTDVGADSSSAAGSPPLVRLFHQDLSGPADVHVRHQWPPCWRKPAAGKWVVIQPWEYGSLPRTWVELLARQVDEAWVYTHFLRQCFLDSGIPAHKVHVVPLGVDTTRYRPGLTPFPLQTGKRFKLLFVGGTIWRKGIDILLEVYARTFTAKDDICLVIKDLGSDTFYRGQHARERIRQLQSQPGAPALEYLDQVLSEEEMARLYAACDCLVHPYRGEGFGLPIIEAMACALPVIATGTGPVQDYASEECAYLLPSRQARFAHKRVGQLETVGYPWLLEPDREALQRCLRRVVAQPEEARARGLAAAAHVQASWRWEQATDRLLERLEQCQRGSAGRGPASRATSPATTVASPERSSPGAAIPAPETASQGKPVTRQVPVASAPGRPPRQRVSLCMIVRNEADKLALCLDSAADLVDEMIVVDTGSTDASREVAARCGARVVSFPWIDDFAAARNESVRHATGEWIFWLDADEHLDASNRPRLQAVFTRLKEEKLAYLMRQLSPGRHGRGTGVAVDQVRLFRREPAVRWQYRVHEQILLSLRRAGHDIRWTDVVIAHSGYQDAARSQDKLERNLRLLKMQDTDQPDEPVTLYHLGVIYSQQGRTEEGLAHLRRSLERMPADYSIRAKVFTLLTQGHHRLGRGGEALKLCRQGREHYPEDAELMFMEGLLLFEQGKLQDAQALLHQLLRLPVRPQLTSVDPGLRSSRVPRLLAAISQKLHEPGQANQAA